MMSDITLTVDYHAIAQWYNTDYNTAITLSTKISKWLIHSICQEYAQKGGENMPLTNIKPHHYTPLEVRAFAWVNHFTKEEARIAIMAVEPSYVSWCKEQYLRERELQQKRRNKK